MVVPRCLQLCRAFTSPLVCRTLSSTHPPRRTTPSDSSPQRTDGRASSSFQVSTFDPGALQASDYVDISLRKTVALPNPDSALCPSRLHYARNASALDPFPQNTRGFFYLYRPTTIHRAADDASAGEHRTLHVGAGQLRFRLVDTPDPAQFAQGRDLTLNSRPWNLHILNMRGIPSRRQIYEFVTSQRQREEMEAFPDPRLTEREAADYARHYRPHSLILDSILEPFLVDFTQNILVMFLLDPEGIVRLRLGNMFTVQPVVKQNTPLVWNPAYGRSPYMGKAWCRFELVHVLRRHLPPSTKLTIRVLEWAERPPDPLPPSPPAADLASQVEGELMRKYDIDKGKQRVWTRKIFLTVPKASLEILKEAYPSSETVAPKSLVPEAYL